MTTMYGQGGAWDLVDFIRLSGLVATAATTLGLVTSPAANRELRTLATAASLVTTIVAFAQPSRCTLCDRRHGQGSC